MVKPFRFGVQCGGDHDRASWQQLAHKIEALGYATLYVPDHFIDTQMAPMVALSVAAEATKTLRVGALVFDNDYKHPAILAKEMATIDQLTDGRCELGIGAGWMKTDYDALGLPYDSPGVRIARLDEAMQVIKGCWADGPFTFEGTHYQVREYDAMPKPVQKPGLPILIGGGGPKVLKLAGREANIVGINPNLRAGAVTADAAASASGAETLKKLEWIREGAGDRFGDIELQIRYFVCAITDDALGFATAVAPGFDATPEEVLGSGAALLGTIP
jgi:probable F420-dependent oxidoreductase